MKVNGNERQELHTILEVLEVHSQERQILSEDVREIKVCLMGDPSKHDDLGLQGEVAKNSAFRKGASKGLWAMFTGFIGLLWFSIKNTLK